MANIILVDGKAPAMHQNVFTISSVDIAGDVRIAEFVNIWNHVTLRGDVNYIQIGKYTNIQDNSVVHGDRPKPDNPDWGATIIGEYVTVGHGAILHACTVEDACLIGMGAIVLDGAVIGKGSVVGAGSVVTQRTVIPPYSMVLGTPAKVVKTLPEESIAERIAHAERYWELTKKYKNEDI